MTQFIKNAIITSVTSLALISAAFGEKCERLEMYDLNFESVQIETDLVSGVWNTDIMGLQSTMYFQEDGRVEIAHTENQTDELTFETWDVRIKDCHSVLTFISVQGVKRTAKLYPTCDGFAIVSSDGSGGVMIRTERKNSAMIERARNQMEGVWEIIAKKMPKRTSRMIWAFNHDGTFSLNIGPDLYHNGYQGIWDIAEDGEHVILYFTHSEGQEEVYAKELVKIDNIDYEDLVLSGETLSKFSGYHDPASKVFFQRHFQ